MFVLCTQGNCFPSWKSRTICRHTDFLLSTSQKGSRYITVRSPSQILAAPPLSGAPRSIHLVPPAKREDTERLVTLRLVQESTPGIYGEVRRGQVHFKRTPDRSTSHQVGWLTRCSQSELHIARDRHPAWPCQAAPSGFPVAIPSVDAYWHLRARMSEGTRDGPPFVATMSAQMAQAQMPP